METPNKRQLLEEQDKNLNALRAAKVELETSLKTLRSKFAQEKAKEIDILNQFKELFAQNMHRDEVIAKIVEFRKLLSQVNNGSPVIKRLQSPTVKHLERLPDEVLYLKKTAKMIYDSVMHSKDWVDFKKWLEKYGPLTGKMPKYFEMRFGDSDTGKKLGKVIDIAYEKKDWHDLLEMDVKKKQGIPSMINNLKSNEKNMVHETVLAIRKTIQAELTRIEKAFSSSKEIKELQEALRKVNAHLEADTKFAKNAVGMQKLLEKDSDDIKPLAEDIFRKCDENQKYLYSVSALIERYLKGELLTEQILPYIGYLDKAADNSRHRAEDTKQIAKIGKQAEEDLQIKDSVLKAIPDVSKRDRELLEEISKLRKAA